MPKKSTKSRSKRVTLHQKYKVLKKIKQHHKKKAKELKKNGGRVKPPKDPGIPSQWPFKEQLIQEIEFERHRAEVAKAARKEAAKERRAERRAAGGDDGDEAMGEEGEEGAARAAELSAMAARAAARGGAYDAEAGARAARGEAGGAEADADRSRRAFYKEFVKVVDASDVIIQVLDARDPLACRAPEVERFVRSRGPDKKLVLLLNKVDLVPKHAAEAWLAYFRGELPTVAFKCATTPNAAASRKPLRAGGGAGSAADGLGGGTCAGADMLLGLLKNYARSRSMKTAITVGVVGLPNVGKSSLINSLCRGRAAATGATPGLTRAAQEVVLDKHVKLLDSPGIVFSTAGAPGDAAAALRNAIRVEKLEDPLPPVGEILKRARPETLMGIYGIPRFEATEDFLRHVAAKRGKLRKGGVPDGLAAARIVLGDWNAGRIPFFTLPPARENAAHDAAAVVSAFSADFDVTAMNSAVIAEDGAAGVAGADAEDFVEMAAPADGGVTTGLAAMEAEVAAAPLHEHDDMADDDAGPAGASAAAAARLRKGKVDARAQNEALYGEDAMYNPRAARAARKRAKKGGAPGDDADGSDGSDFDWDGSVRAAAGGAAAADDEDEDDDDEAGEGDGDGMRDD